MFNGGGLDDDISQHIEDVVLENVEATTSTKKFTCRGPSKPVNVSTPMFLEFDEHDLPTGDWGVHYGKQTTWAMCVKD